MRPTIALSSVVFPPPLGPIRPKILPSSTARVTRSRTSVSPRTTSRPSVSIIGPRAVIGPPSSERLLDHADVIAHQGEIVLTSRAPGAPERVEEEDRHLALP